MVEEPLPLEEHLSHIETRLDRFLEETSLEIEYKFRLDRKINPLRIKMDGLTSMNPASSRMFAPVATKRLAASGGRGRQEDHR